MADCSTLWSRHPYRTPNCSWPIMDGQLTVHWVQYDFPPLELRWSSVGAVLRETGVSSHAFLWGPLRLVTCLMSFFTLLTALRQVTTDNWPYVKHYDCVSWSINPSLLSWRAAEEYQYRSSGYHRRSASVCSKSSNEWLGVTILNDVKQV